MNITFIKIVLLILGLIIDIGIIGPAMVSMKSFYTPLIYLAVNILIAWIIITHITLKFKKGKE